MSTQFDARKKAHEIVRMAMQQIKFDWRPGQHVMTPEWLMEGYISEALDDAYHAGCGIDGQQSREETN